MRTPIATIIFFIQMLLSMISNADKFEKKDLPQCVNYCTIITSQLELLQSFIEDLLDLKQIRDGIFSLASEPFDVTSII